MSKQTVYLTVLTSVFVYFLAVAVLAYSYLCIYVTVRRSTRRVHASGPAGIPAAAGPTERVAENGFDAKALAPVATDESTAGGTELSPQLSTVQRLVQRHVQRRRMRLSM